MDTKTGGLNFGEALVALKEGMYLHREGWNGKNQFIALQVPTELSKMTVPYIFMVISHEDSTDTLVPWLASQTDMLAEDWAINLPMQTEEA